MYDMIVVGGGPAGMTAALYGLRNGRTVLVIEKSGFGGQITHSPRVENYPGTLSLSGNELADRMMTQILEQGAELELETVTAVEDQGNVKVIRTEEGSTFEGRTVILATGVKHRQPGIEGEQELIGEGISFCAVCDGDFYKGKTVCVLGGGNSALQEALLLSEKCKSVIILQDLPRLTGEERLQKALQNKENVSCLTGIRLVEYLRDDSGLQGVVVEHTDNGKRSSIPCDGLFIAIGLIPENENFRTVAELDAQGYFMSDDSCRTGTTGVFVAGDCRKKQIRQLTTAMADGTAAALAACDYLSQQE